MVMPAIATFIPVFPLLMTSEIAQGLSIWQSIMVGIVQGITEFLPISSTAHIKMVPVVLGWGDPGVAFTAVVQLGSIGAILSYFWADVKTVCQGMARAIAHRQFEDTDFQVGLGILVGTLPIVVCGLLLKFFLRESYETLARGSVVIGVTSIALAVLLGVAEWRGKRHRGYDKVGLWDGIGMGWAQALALIPGVSRSGATITAGLFMGFDRATAARFSLLMGIPAIVLSGIAELDQLFAPDFQMGAGAIAAGVISAAISSYIAIYWLLHFLRNHTTWVFVFYRIAFGTAILWGVASQKIPN